MANPGVPGSKLPLGEDAIPRALKDLTRQATEDRAAVAQSFGPVIADLQAQDVIIAGQVAALAAANVTLSAAVANIQTLVGQQVAVVSGAPQTTTGWATSTGMVAKASTTIAVPAGFSRATVEAQANMHFQDSSPNGGYIRANIAGNAGGEMGGLANLNVGQSASHTADFTGLSGGTITVTAEVRSVVASGAGTGRIAQITAKATFTR